ncbi:MAG: GGDEF domain-containing protein [Patescibacteria group bacterium]|nr:GGDEF domain-containing protein [Patescibacteria group bacterium]
MEIDVRTLVLVVGIVQIIQVIAVFLQYLLNKTYSEMKWWVLGYTLLAIGYGLWLLREIPFWGSFAIYFGNTSQLLGASSIYVGIMRFLNKKERREVILTLIVLFLIVFGYYTFVQNDLTVRTALLSITLALLLFLISRDLFIYKLPEVSVSASFTAIIFLAYSCFFVLRAIAVMTITPVNDFFASTLIQNLTFILQLVVGFLSVIGLITMVNQRLHAELQQQASIDELTGIFNRRYFWKLAIEEIKRAKRYGYPLSLVIIDVDHFKHINDTFGHLTGDFVLTSFAALCKKCFRDVDVVARFGGDEFAVLFPMTTSEQAFIAIERLRSALKTDPFQRDNLTIKITISVGISSLSNGSESLDALLARVDIALHKAKENGRDSIKILPTQS